MSKTPVDLRSDTITRPTAAMRQHMAEADVGDDVLGDDPTVLGLECQVAGILGKESALFVPSGTMANQLAIRCQTQPGDEILLESQAHIYWYEAGAPAALSGVTSRLITGERGIFSAEQVHAALRPANIHFPPTRLLALENTHNRGGGAIWSLEEMTRVCEVAHDAGLAIHLDGARLWNAAVATGVAEAEYAAGFDSVSVCFSKGLGAPVGSALAGSMELISKARHFRKMLGGGMRQAGIIAAGALYAIDNHRERLVQDHDNARRLAEGLANIAGLHITMEEVVSNMVYFELEGQCAATFAAELNRQGVLLLPTGPSTLRAVTSLEVDADAIDRAIAAIAGLMTS